MPNLLKTDGWFKLFERYAKLQKFARPPQFRYPDTKHHPEWINFSEGGCFQYRKPRVLGQAQLELTINLIDPVTENTFKPYTCEIALDERLKSLQDRQVFQVPKGKWIKTLDGQRLFDWQTDEENNPLYTEEMYYLWTDPDGVLQRIQIHGGNLIYRKESFYLHFRYTYKTPKKPKLRVNVLPGFNYAPGTRLLAVDQGQKNDAIITILELAATGELQSIHFTPFQFKQHKEVKPRKDGKPPGKVLYQWIALPGGIGFKAISHAERVRSNRIKSVKRNESAYVEKQKEEGKFVPVGRKTEGRFLARGKVFDKKLKDYIEHCRELHYKTIAGVLFKLAKDNGCQGIVVEDLKSYKTTLKQERFENGRLMIWAMQKKLDFLKMLCDSGEINFIKRSAAYTSQTCNRCESWGVRFNFPTEKEWKRDKPSDAGNTSYPLIRAGGDWFLCSNEKCPGKKESENPKTRYMIQADANAAKNIAIRAFRADGWGARLDDKEERKRRQKELQGWLKTHYTKQPVLV